MSFVYSPKKITRWQLAAGLLLYLALVPGLQYLYEGVLSPTRLAAQMLPWSIILLINLFRKPSRLTISPAGVEYSGQSQSRIRNFAWTEVENVQLVPFLGSRSLSRAIWVSLHDGSSCWLVSRGGSFDIVYVPLDAAAPTVEEAISQYWGGPLTEVAPRRLPGDAGAEGRRVLLLLPCLFVIAAILAGLGHAVNWSGTSHFLYGAGAISAALAILYMRRTHLGINMLVTAFFAPVAAWFCWALLVASTALVGPVETVSFRLEEMDGSRAWVSQSSAPAPVLIIDTPYSIGPFPARGSLGAIRQVPLHQGPAGLWVVPRSTWILLHTPTVHEDNAFLGVNRQGPGA